MPKRILQGRVTSDKNEQTITVLVERRFTHPVMKKTVRKSKKYRAHGPFISPPSSHSTICSIFMCAASNRRHCFAPLSLSVKALSLGRFSSFVEPRSASTKPMYSSCSTSSHSR